jgi:hypothetical protein
MNPSVKAAGLPLLRSSQRDYRPPDNFGPRCDVDRSIYVRGSSVPAVLTDKLSFALAVNPLTTPAQRTALGGTARVYQTYHHTRNNGLVFDEGQSVLRSRSMLDSRLCYPIGRFFKTFHRLKQSAMLLFGRSQFEHGNDLHNRNTSGSIDKFFLDKERFVVRRSERGSYFFSLLKQETSWERVR